jgi:hypothetical protein
VGLVWQLLVGQGGRWSGGRGPGRCLGLEGSEREREVRRAAAWFFLIDAQDSHGSFPPSSKHYKTKGRDGW